MFFLLAISFHALTALVSAQKPAQLEARLTSEKFLEQASILLNCDHVVMRPIAYEWYQNGQPMYFPGPVPSFVEFAANTDTAGSYYCRAQDSQTNEWIASHPIHIDVVNRNAICLLPKDLGPCKGIHTAWYYSAADSKCLQFYYGGCEGNDNRFESEEDCLTTCAVGGAKRNQTIRMRRPLSLVANQSPDVTTTAYATVTDATSTESPSFATTTGFQPGNAPAQPKNVDCYFKVDYGNCSALMQRYYFDTGLGRCQPFFWSGCGGNPNRFFTNDECNDVCLQGNARRQRPPAPPSQVNTVCSDNEEYQVCGTCDPTCDFVGQTNVLCPSSSNACRPGCLCKPGYYRNRTGQCVLAQQCEQRECRDLNAVYTDCGNPCRESCADSARNIPCLATCVQGCFCRKGYKKNRIGDCVPESQCPHFDTSVCILPLAYGTCSVLMNKFFYNTTSRRCEPFIFNGCEGNANNFPTQQQCEATCNRICPDGFTAPPCAVDPCRNATCPKHPDALCRADYCSGCNARFFDANEQEISAPDCYPWSTAELCNRVSCGYCRKCVVVAGVATCAPDTDTAECA